MTRKPKAAAADVSAAPSDALLTDLRRLIESARRTAAQAVNASLTLMYWHIGQRIRGEVLGGQRAGYGDEIISTLSRQLTADYGRGFSAKNLHRMVQFAEAFPDETIVATAWRHLSWSHFRALLPPKRTLQRELYAQMCITEGWSVRTLAERIDSALYERTALSRQPEAFRDLLGGSESPPQVDRSLPPGSALVEPP